MPWTPQQLAPFLFVGVAILVVVVVLLLSRHFDLKRREGMAQAALEMGFAFTPEATLAEQPWAGLPLFGRGHSRKLKNLASGSTAEGELWLGDFRYTTGGGKHSATHSQTVAVVRASAASLPAFELRPEGFVDKLAARLGYEDLDVDTHPEFSRRYLLRGQNAAAVLRLFGPAALEYFSAHHGLSVEGAAAWLVVWRQHRAVKPEQVRAFREEACAVARALFPV